MLDLRTKPHTLQRTRVYMALKQIGGCAHSREVHLRGLAPNRIWSTWLHVFQLLSSAGRSNHVWTTDKYRNQVVRLPHEYRVTLAVMLLRSITALRSTWL